MKVPSHLVGLYNRTVRRYRKLAARLRKEKDPRGYRYLTLIQKLRKLQRRITDLHLQLKLATASGVLILGLSLSSHAQTTNGPFVPQPRHLNPLREPFKFDGSTYPAIVDLDKDGDFDLLVADEGNYSYNQNYSTINPMRYMLNIGTNTNPVFEEKSGVENPFDSIDILNRDRGPVFVDIDADGDQDLFVGLRDYYETRILYFRNDNGVFNEQTTAWDPVAKTGNPFLGIDVRDQQKLAFADIDNDSDPDVIITGAPDPSTRVIRFIHYYKNDGQGTFTQANNEVTFSPMPPGSLINPALADIDEDGDVDLVLGGYYFGLHYYKQVSPGNFVEETGAYDPVSKTGNPFADIYEPNTQPEFVDIDNDGDLDLLLGDGDGDHYYAFPSHIIHFFENKGGGVFEEIQDLDNPLGGVDLRQEASPVLIDLDGDNDLDAVIGHKYEEYYLDYNTPAHYSYEGDRFVRQSVQESPFGGIQIAGTIIPSLVDLDADGDPDLISGELFGGIRFFRNTGGTYTEEPDNNPFEGIDAGNKSSPEFADMDGDGDLDLIVGSNYDTQIYYFENTGTPQAPVFEERIGDENPFNTATGGNSFRGYLTVVDLDHDGDMDLIATEYFTFKYYEFNQLTYYENVGTPTNAQFELTEEQPFTYLDAWTTFGYFSLQPYLADQDQDGDLDLFTGNYFGTVQYTRNENPAVVTTLASPALTYLAGTDDDIAIDPTLTLADEDDDLIVMATVAVDNYEQGDELHFVAQANISGAFDVSTGILALKGKATRQEYQALLRTVTYRHQESEGGRTSPRKNSTVTKAIEFLAYDTDFTNPQVASRDLNVVFNEPPVLEGTNETTQSGNTISIDLNGLMSDPDDNLDPSTLRIVQQPASGAAAHIDANFNLIINYTGTNFTGTDELTVEVCDDLGECARNIITIEVESTGKVEIYNAVAPNSTGDNRFMRIHNLPEGNRVTIFSRWGDKVFEVGNYDSNISGKRFEGKRDNGKALPTGTYFYKIEIPDTPGYTGPKQITGYISLKQ